MTKFWQYKIFVGGLNQNKNKYLAQQKFLHTKCFNKKMSTYIQYTAYYNMQEPIIQIEKDSAMYSLK